MIFVVNIGTTVRQVIRVTTHSGYQPIEEGEGRDVNNDNSGACCRTDQSTGSWCQKLLNVLSVYL